jgi:uncharacterized protein (DUF302 family)
MPPMSGRKSRQQLRRTAMYSSSRSVHRALQAEDKIGTMLPCNVIVQDVGNGQVEVAAIDPAASMERVGKPELTELAHTVRTKLQAVLARL